MLGPVPHFVRLVVEREELDEQSEAERASGRVEDGSRGKAGVTDNAMHGMGVAAGR